MAVERANASDRLIVISPEAVRRGVAIDAWAKVPAASMMAIKAEKAVRGWLRDK